MSATSSRRRPRAGASRPSRPARRQAVASARRSARPAPRRWQIGGAVVEDDRADHAPLLVAASLARRAAAAEVPPGGLDVPGLAGLPAGVTAVVQLQRVNAADPAAGLRAECVLWQDDGAWPHARSPRAAQAAFATAASRWAAGPAGRAAGTAVVPVGAETPECLAEVHLAGPFPAGDGALAAVAALRDRLVAAWGAEPLVPDAPATPWALRAPRALPVT